MGFSGAVSTAQSFRRDRSRLSQPISGLSLKIKSRRADEVGQLLEGLADFAGGWAGGFEEDVIFIAAAVPEVGGPVLEFRGHVACDVVGEDGKFCVAWAECGESVAGLQATVEFVKFIDVAVASTSVLTEVLPSGFFCSCVRMVMLI